MIDLLDVGRAAVEYPAFRPTSIEEIRRRADRRRMRRRGAYGGLAAALALVVFVAILPLVGGDGSRSLPVATSPGSTLASEQPTTSAPPPTERDAPPVSDARTTPTSTIVESGPVTTVAPSPSQEPVPDPVPNAAPAPDPEPTTPPGSPPTTAIPVDSCARSSLVATVSTGQTTYRPGVPISIQGSVYNQGTGPCVLRGGGPPVRPSIRNAAGQEVVQFAYAAYIYPDAVIEPGQSSPFNTTWNQQACLATCADAPPGIYTVTVTWSFAVGAVEASSSFTLAP